MKIARLSQRIKDAGQKVADKVEAAMTGECPGSRANSRVMPIFRVDPATVMLAEADWSNLWGTEPKSISPEAIEAERALQLVEDEIGARGRALRDIVFGVLNPDSELFCSPDVALDDLSVEMRGLVRHRNECRGQIAALEPMRTVDQIIAELAVLNDEQRGLAWSPEPPADSAPTDCRPGGTCGLDPSQDSHRSKWNAARFRFQRKERKNS